MEDRGDGTVAVSATPPRRSTYVELAVSVDGAPVGPFRVPCYDAAPSPRAPPDEPGSPPRLAPVAPPPEAAVALCPRRTKLLALPAARDAGAQVVLRAVDAASAAVGATAVHLCVAAHQVQTSLRKSASRLRHAWQPWRSEHGRNGSPASRKAVANCAKARRAAPRNMLRAS